jgi:DNA adenine methylase
MVLQNYNFRDIPMAVIATKQCLAKPFLKWAGGKSQLLAEIGHRLPEELDTGEIDAYVEPFVGGGAVFFYIAQKYKSIKHFYLLDINGDLVGCYNAVKRNIESLIAELKSLQRRFFALGESEQEQFYFDIRKRFNSEKLSGFETKTAAKLIFLNKTCYNGLYRVNRKNEFNVPFGHYKNPTICDAENLLAVSEVLRKVQILCSDFEDSDKYIDKRTFVYLDPPYRPISPTASFTSYSKDDFSEKDQIRLAEFCKRVHRKGARFLLSNSDPKNEDPRDHFFDDQYNGFKSDTVKAIRAINCIGAGRGAINELIITNY